MRIKKRKINCLTKHGDMRSRTPRYLTRLENLMLINSTIVSFILLKSGFESELKIIQLQI